MRRVRPLRQSEREELERMRQQEIGRVAMCAQMSLLSANGYRVPKISTIQQVTDVTVYKWLDRFEAEGAAGLYDRVRRGRPRKFDEEAEAALIEALSAPPTELGYNFTCWTVPLLTRHLEQSLDVTLCQETVRTHLHGRGFRWRRPRWAVRREDPQAAERMKTIGRTILAADEETVVLLEDETMLKTLPVLRRMWMRQGEQVRVPTPRQNENLYVYGALDLASGEWTQALYDKANSANTIAYLEHLLAQFPQQSLLLIWDQATYHTSRRVEDWLADPPRLQVLRLPKYAAELNPVESIWRHLKNRVAANLTRSLQAIRTACIRFFAHLRPADLLRMASLLA